MTTTLAIPRDVPERLRDVVEKLYSYGYKLDHGPVWILAYPPGDRYGRQRTTLSTVDFESQLLRTLRSEEQQQHVLYRYEQFDARWGKVVYGDRPGSTTIEKAGCGPTSLAIVLQYLMNDPRRAKASSAVPPPETASYAETHGRAYGKDGKPSGTAGDPMIQGIKEKWPEFDGSRVTLDEAADLLAEGKLLIFLCKGCQGWSRQRPVHRKPDVHYGGHYMVLAGIEGPAGPDQLFYVVDPGRNVVRAMRHIRRAQLQSHTAGFWWVYRKGEPATRASMAE